MHRPLMRHKTPKFQTLCIRNGLTRTCWFTHTRTKSGITFMPSRTLKQYYLSVRIPIAKHFGVSFIRAKIEKVTYSSMSQRVRMELFVTLPKQPRKIQEKVLNQEYLLCGLRLKGFPMKSGQYMESAYEEWDRLACVAYTTKSITKALFHYTAMYSNLAYDIFDWINTLQASILNPNPHRGAYLTKTYLASFGWQRHW